MSAARNPGRFTRRPRNSPDFGLALGAARGADEVGDAGSALPRIEAERGPERRVTVNLLHGEASTKVVCEGPASERART